MACRMGHEVKASPERAETGDVMATSLVDAPSSVSLQAFTCSTEMEGAGVVVARGMEPVEGSGSEGETKGGVTGVVVARGVEPVEGSGSEGGKSPGAARTERPGLAGLAPPDASK
jgi:hypothetical protein